MICNAANVKILGVGMVAFILLGFGVNQAERGPTANRTPATRPTTLPAHPKIWGPGVKDVMALVPKMKNQIKLDSEDPFLKNVRETYAAEAILHVATFEQACHIYRDGPEDMKQFLIFAIVVDQKDWIGLTKDELVALLGKPDMLSGAEWIYGDNSAGVLFFFKKNGRVEHFGYGNN
jgi:hypothetical protein